MATSSLASAALPSPAAAASSFGGGAPVRRHTRLLKDRETADNDSTPDPRFCTPFGVVVSFEMVCSDLSPCETDSDCSEIKGEGTDGAVIRYVCVSHPECASDDEQEEPPSTESTGPSTTAVPAAAAATTATATATTKINPETGGQEGLADVAPFRPPGRPSVGFMPPLQTSRCIPESALTTIEGDACFRRNSCTGQAECREGDVCAPCPKPFVVDCPEGASC